MFPTGYTAAAK